MRILIIEDDAKTADFVVRGFQKAGFQTCHCADGSAGLDKAKSEPFDAAVIDIMLPKMDGFTVIDKIRAAKINLPIIVLSAKDSVESKIKGLEKGGDDYLAKPFSLSELIARVQALLRRASAIAEPGVLTVEDLKVDVLSRKVTRAGQRILFLELGVGYNTPSIIKYPFWRMTDGNPRAVYACLNAGDACAPDAIKDRSVCIDGDLADILAQI